MHAAHGTDIHEGVPYLAGQHLQGLTLQLHAQGKLKLNVSHLVPFTRRLLPAGFY